MGNVKKGKGAGKGRVSGGKAKEGRKEPKKVREDTLPPALCVFQHQREGGTPYKVA